MVGDVAVEGEAGAVGGEPVITGEAGAKMSDPAAARLEASRPAKVALSRGAGSSVRAEESAVMPIDLLDEGAAGTSAMATESTAVAAVQPDEVAGGGDDTVVGRHPEEAGAGDSRVGDGGEEPGVPVPSERETLEEVLDRIRLKS